MFAFDKPVVWILIIVVIILLFGASRLTDVGKSLGKGIREFKEEISVPDKDKKSESTVSTIPNTVSSSVSPAADEEVVITRRERKREDGSTEVIEERVVRKRS
jgi:sec-independent protein translocase protein TatA